MKNRKFVEFYGITGGGKTTVCNKLEELLVKKGWTVLRYDTFFYSISKGRFWRIKLIFSTGFFENIIMMLLCFSLYISIKKRYKNDMGHCRFIVLNYMVAKNAFNVTNADYILCDQGFVQSIVSLFFDRKINDEKRIIYKLVDKYKEFF